MDAPRTDSWRELKMWAADRQKWQMRVQAVRSDAKVAITGAIQRVRAGVGAVRHSQ